MESTHEAFFARGTIGRPVGPPARGEDLSAFFIKEAPKAWAIYEKLFDQLEGTVTYTTMLPEGDFYERGVIRYLRNGECQLAEVISYEDRPRRGFQPQLHCRNDSYGFRLVRPSTDDPWQVKAIYLDPKSQPSEWPQWLFRRSLENVSPVTLSGRPLRVIVRDGGFRVTRADRISDERFQIDFTLDDAHEPVRQRDFAWMKSGRLVLNPARSWTLVSANYVTASRTTTEITFTFDKNSKYFPSHVRSISSSLDKPKAKSSMTIDCNLKWVEFPAERERFTLDAFGFPEPTPKGN